MSEQHREEQEMEAEALEAIFDTAFEIRSSEQPFAWAVKLMPVDCGGDPNEEQKFNHVMIKLIARIPLEYPEETLPQFDLEILKGLSEDNKKEILQLANQEAEANTGMPSIFAVCEAVRSWLEDNNVKGLDDASMHAQMMRKEKEAKRKEAQAAQQYESQAAQEVMTQAEQEELAVRKRREEGTPVTDTSFAEWWAKYSAETTQARAEEKAAMAEHPKDKKIENIMEERLTGFQIFSEKAGVFSLEKLEAAAEEMEHDTSALDSEELVCMDQELFEDDDDLDDLDFDSDDEDHEEDSDKEPDI